jgi:endoglucanase
MKYFHASIPKFLLFSLLTLQLNLSAQSGKFISVQGKNIVDPDGKNFLIKGTNLGNWLVPEGYMFGFSYANCPRLINEVLLELTGPDYTKTFWKKYLEGYVAAKDIHYLKSLGMNSIRVPFNYKLFSDEPYLGQKGPAEGFALMDKLIGWCREEHLYVILDMHCAPGGQTGDNIDDGYGYPFLFDNPGSQTQTIAIWRQIADHYKNEPTVMGYDLLNEPIATYFDSAYFNPRLEPLYKRIVKAIREVDPNHLVFLGGAQWDSNFSDFGPPFDSKSVYTFHKYWTSPTQDVIASYIDFRDKYNVPIYCGETGENDDAWIEAFSKLLEKNNIGWHFWPYKKINSTRGIVSFPVPPGYALVSVFADTTRSSFKDIRKTRPKDLEAIKKALDGFLENSLFSYCSPNPGYIKALGLGKDPAR